MIRRLEALLEPGQVRELRRVTAWMAASAALQGAAAGLLLPFFRALLRRHGGTASCVPWLLGILALVMAYCVVHRIAVYRARAMGYSISGTLLDRVGDHVVRLPLGWFGPQRVGSFGRLAGANIMSILQVPAHLLEPLTTAVVAPAVTVLVMATVDWRLALLALAASPLVFLAARRTGQKIASTDAELERSTAELAARSVEFAQSQPVLRAFGRTDTGLELLDTAVAEHRTATMRRIRHALPAFVGLGLTIQGALALLICVIVVLRPDLDPAALATSLVLAVRFSEPMVNAGALSAVLRMSDRSLARVEEVLMTPPLPEPEESAPTGAPSIELSGVSFAYPGQPETLSQVSFQVPAGGVTALVGPSGSGKTTVLHLIARFHDPQKGVIRVGGVDAADLTVADLTSLLSLVTQDVYLFEGSLEDNIRQARPEATTEQVREAARLARVDEIAERLPAGWESKVGEGGESLSGGERQRVSIARALLKDAPIVLLDEATSALDPENEASVLAAIHALAQRRTVLMVAHRLTTVREADQIVVLEQGRVVEQGSHSDLLAAGGRYADFWQARNASAGWRITRDAR